MEIDGWCKTTVVVGYGELSENCPHIRGVADLTNSHYWGFIGGTARAAPMLDGHEHIDTHTTHTHRHTHISRHVHLHTNTRKCS